jgi:hypothetical protein
LNGDSFGGIVKINTLLDKINSLESFQNKVTIAKNAIDLAALSSPSTPVTNATLSAFLTSIPAIPVIPTTIIELENTTVKHGS